LSGSRYGRYVGLLGLIVLLGFVVRALFISPIDPKGIPPGQRVPPFAMPLAQGNLSGDADIATHANDGEQGKVPACAERGAQILNVCQLYEQGPLVLALFVDSGSCTRVLSSMQTLIPEFPEVRFAAVAIRGERLQLRALMHRRHLTLPIGIDNEGTVAGLYKVFTCPQVNFIYPGGVVQGKALLGNASLAALRSHVSALVASARTRERREPAA
jgi:predicted amino acid-binding ACT domain protein